MSAAHNSVWDKSPAPPSGERRPSFGVDTPRKDPWQGAGLIVALIASIGLHGVIVVGTVVVNYLEKRNAPPPETVIELVDASQFPKFVPPPPSAANSGGPAAAVPAPVPEIPPDENTVPKKQLVELAKPDSAQTAPADAKYLAEHNHRVKEETAARETAMAPKVLAPDFRGTGDSNAKDAGKLEGAPDKQGEGIGTDAKTEHETAGKAPTAAERSPDRPVDSLLTEDPFGIRIKPRAAASTEVADAGRVGTGDRDVSTMAGGNGSKVAMAGAPNNDYLPNVRPGDKTQLNAKEFKFASFWHRVQRQVEPFWASNVRSASPGQIQKRDYMTRVNLVLGPDGSLVGVEIVKSCGVPAWDRAVVDAFTEAAPFLNPPAALVEADGKIHMGDLGFIVSLTGGQIVHMYGDPRAGKLFPGVGEGYGPGR